MGDTNDFGGCKGVNVKQTAAMLAIVVTLASVVGAAYITYDTTKEEKRKNEQQEARLIAVERELATFKGVIDERTRNMQSDIGEIKGFMKTLIDTWDFSDGEAKSDTKKEEISLSQEKAGC